MTPRRSPITLSSQVEVLSGPIHVLADGSLFPQAARVVFFDPPVQVAVRLSVVFGRPALQAIEYSTVDPHRPLRGVDAQHLGVRRLCHDAIELVAQTVGSGTTPSARSPRAPTPEDIGHAARTYVLYGRNWGSVHAVADELHVSYSQAKRLLAEARRQHLLG